MNIGTFIKLEKRKWMNYKFCIVSILLFVAIEASAFEAPGTRKNKVANPFSHKRPVKSFKAYTISGKVTQVFPYCGGAMPTDEILKGLKTPTAFANKKFYLRSGKVNNTKSKIIKSFTTDSSGRFSFRLPVGTYSIILEEQVTKIKAEDYKKQSQSVDKQCLDEWWAKPYYLLVVKNADIHDLNFSFTHRCFINSDIPCIIYHGPPAP